MHVAVSGAVLRGGGTALLCLLLALPAGVLAPASSHAAVRGCTSGTVALTFDDGPAAAVTGRLLDVLSSRKVPATFFVLGQRVAASPKLVRRAGRLGFVVANHTYGHEMLTRLSDRAVRRTVRATADRIRAAGARPAPLVRPPYGAVDDHVRSVIARLGMTTVLWDVDPRDWESGTPGQIADRVLSHLRPHGRNIVLLHDGVARSADTLRAVPLIVTGARARGYCFRALGAGGSTVPPRPRVEVADAEVREAGPGTTTALVFAVRLDRESTRRTSVRVRTVALTAAAGRDFRAVDRRTYLPAGTRRTTVRVEVLGDRVDETRELLRLRLEDPRGLRIVDGRADGLIRDDDPVPRVRLSDVTVTEPTGGVGQATVTLRLDRPSSRTVEVRVATVTGTADALDFAPADLVVTLPEGATHATVTVDVLPDDLIEDVETFEVHVLSTVRALVGDGVATVTVEPPPEPTPVEPTPVDPSLTDPDRP